jgi:hypothetical protein
VWAVLAILRFASGCHWFRPIGSIDDPYLRRTDMAGEPVVGHGSQLLWPRRPQIPPVTLTFSLAVMRASTPGYAERYIHAAQVLFPGAAARAEERMFSGGNESP